MDGSIRGSPEEEREWKKRREMRSVNCEPPVCTAVSVCIPPPQKSGYSMRGKRGPARPDTKCQSKHERKTEEEKREREFRRRRRKSEI